MLHLAWIIPLLPLAACAVLIFFGSALRHRMGERVGWIGVAGIAATIPFSVGCLVELMLGASSVDVTAVWGHIGSRALEVGYAVDPLGAVMLSMVSIVATCIQVYSIGYMHGDARFQRFFAYLSLFCACMFTLVLANNFVMIYGGWELVGLCSYLLIGFWYDRSPESQVDKVAPYQAGMKAFMTTRVADVILILGIAYLWASTGTLSFREIFFSEATLHMLAETPAVGGFLGLSAAGLIGICIVIGTIGKSAQFPLHV